VFNVHSETERVLLILAFITRVNVEHGRSQNFTLGYKCSLIVTHVKGIGNAV